MKKIVVLSILSSIFVMSCTSPNATSQTSKTKQTNLWHVAPSIDATTLDNLTQFSQKKFQYQTYTVIYPYEQNASDCMHAILIQNGDEQKVYDYDGNVIYTLPIPVSQTINKEGFVQGYAQLDTQNHYFDAVYGTSTSEKAYILKQDLSTSEISVDAWIPHPFDGNQVYDTLAIQNDKLGILTHLKNSDGEDQAGYQFMEYTPDNLPETFIAQNVSSSNVPLEKVIVSTNQEIESVVSDDYDVSSPFMNGYYRIKHKKTYSIVSSTDGKQITKDTYQNTGYFMDGYCPVQNQDGKWAYINTEGTYVTDFMFDDASSLCDGKAFVIKENKAGILNLKDNVSKDVLTEKQLYAENMQADITSLQNTVAVSIGKVSIVISSINVRKDASTSSEKDGTVSQGEIYDVYEIKEAEGYTWYKIGENKWIASNGDWVTYIES